MHHIIYSSQATVPFGEAQLQALLARARDTNAQYGITGILLYGNEQFLQVLEGERATVQARYDRIRQDPRHRDIVTFADQAIEARAFPSWYMDFRVLPPQPLLEFANYNSLAIMQPDAVQAIQADAYLTHLLSLAHASVEVLRPRSSR